MTGKPIDEEAVAQVCDRMLTAAIGKDWRKRAPEAVTAFWMGEVREALQEAVRALTAAQQQGQAVAYIEHSADKSSAVHMTQAGMQLGIGRHACYTAAPPSAPVAADWITGDGLQGIKAEAHFLTQHADETVQRVGRRLIERVDKIIAALAQQPAAEEQLTYKGVPIGPMQTFADMERQASAPVGVEDIAMELERYADCPGNVEAVLRMFLTGDGFIAECDIPHIVAALAQQPEPKAEARGARIARRRDVRLWMRHNAGSYSTATELAEAADEVFNLPDGGLDNETHWVWDEAAEAVDDSQRGGLA